MRNFIINNAENKSAGVLILLCILAKNLKLLAEEAFNI